MIDVQTALKAHLPFIGAYTDDLINLKAVLQSIAGKPAIALPNLKQVAVGPNYVYWTQDTALITTEMYRKLNDVQTSCIVLNLVGPHPLVFEAGILPTPTQFHLQYLKGLTTDEIVPAIAQVLKGLSLKAAQEVVQLTMARTAMLTSKEVRKTRQMLGVEHPGLSTLETDYDFYEWPKPLKEWVDLNDKYFLDPNTPQQLVPRGLLLAGEPGVGKSMAAMVIAKHWDVPLLRLDVSSSLTRWLGESESRIARSLKLIEQSAPNVWLLDEAEKLFSANGDEGTPMRILSQLLWWLQSHKSRVLTVITTNDIHSLPKELYRAERVDKTIHIEKLSLNASKAFASRVYESVIGKPPTTQRFRALRDLLDGTNQGALAHAEVRMITYECIKARNWLEGDK